MADGEIKYKMFEELGQKLKSVSDILDELRKLLIFEEDTYKTVKKFVKLCDAKQENRMKRAKKKEDIDLDGYSLIIISTQYAIVNFQSSSGTSFIELNKIISKHNENFEERNILNAVSLGLLVNELSADVNSIVATDGKWKDVEYNYQKQINNNSTTISSGMVANLYAAYVFLKMRKKDLVKAKNFQIGLGKQWNPNQSFEQMLYQMTVIWNNLKYQEYTSKKNEQKTINIEKKIYGKILEIGSILIAIVGVISFNLSAVLSADMTIANVLLINMILSVVVCILLIFITIILHQGMDMIKKVLGMLVVLLVVLIGFLLLYANIENIIEYITWKGKS